MKNINKEDIICQLIIDIEAGCDSHYIDTKLDDAGLNDDEKHSIILTLQPFQIRYFKKREYRQQGLTLLMIALILIVIGLVFLKYGIIPVGALAYGFYLMYRGNVFYRSSIEENVFVKHPKSIFRQTQIREW